MALSGDTNPGLPFINSIVHEPEGIIKKKQILPLTALHRVGIVSMYSYSDTVNPIRQNVRDSAPRSLTKKRTVDLVMILHIQEWIIIEVAKESDRGPR